MTVGERLRTAGCGGSVTPGSGVISVVNSPDPFREGSFSSGQTKAPASAGLPLITQGVPPQRPPAHQGSAEPRSMQVVPSGHPL